MLTGFRLRTSGIVARQCRLMSSSSILKDRGAWKQSLSPVGFAGAIAFAGVAAYSVVGSSNVSMCESTTEVLVGKETDFVSGELYEVPVGDDRHVLVSRRDGKLFAVGSRCSHYGYPLVKGVLSGNEVVCPLHDAAFDVLTGRPVRGPGLDAIPTYPVRVKGGDVFVTVPTKNFVAKTSVTMAKRDLKNSSVYVIVGGGAAGLSAAETLRYEGYTGRIVLISAENHLPYDRPVLSKKLPVRGKIDGLFLRSRAHLEETAGIELRLGTTVDSVDIANKSLILSSGGEPLRFDKCLIATGGKPRELCIPGAGASNVYVLRTIDDALALGEFVKGQKIAIVGGSFIGMEIASTLVGKGVDVTIVSKTSVPYEGVFGKKIGAFFANLLDEREIKWVGNSTVKIFRRDSDSGLVNAIELDDGDVLPVDAVVVGAGVIPNVPANIPLAADGSVRANPFLEFAPDFFVAGDICTFPYVKTGTDLRVEHWDVAVQQGRVAARNMLGQHVPYADIPYFWTMVFGKSLRYVGHLDTQFDSVFIEGDITKGEFVAFYILGGKIAAVATVGKDPVAVACGELMRRKMMPSPAELQLGTINSDGILQRLKDSNDAKKRTRILSIVEKQ